MVSDLGGATSAENKYLLDIGTGSDGLQRYQELFEGTWIQYGVQSNTIYYEDTNTSGELDSDGDGVNDIADYDDDNYGILDSQDSLPLEPDAAKTSQKTFKHLLETIQRARDGWGVQRHPLMYLAATITITTAVSPPRGGVYFTDNLLTLISQNNYI